MYAQALHSGIKTKIPRNTEFCLILFPFAKIRILSKRLKIVFNKRIDTVNIRDLFPQKREDNLVENPHVPAVRSGFFRNSLRVFEGKDLLCIGRLGGNNLGTGRNVCRYFSLW